MIYMSKGGIMKYGIDIEIEQGDGGVVCVTF